MLLLVGLGNPGARYARQRHNIGMAVEAVARAYRFGPWRSKFSSLVDGFYDVKVLLQKPQTFMNRPATPSPKPRGSTSWH